MEWHISFGSARRGFLGGSFCSTLTITTKYTKEERDRLSSLGKWDDSIFTVDGDQHVFNELLPKSFQGLKIDPNAPRAGSYRRYLITWRTVLDHTFYFNEEEAYLPFRYQLLSMLDQAQVKLHLRGDDYGGRLTTTTMAGWGSLRPT